MDPLLRLLTPILLAFALPWSTIGQDSTLMAYPLTAAQLDELSFSSTSPAPFWNRDWEGRDSIALAPPGNC